MAITREKKETIVSKATEAFKDSVASVFVSFTKLTVAEASELRAELKKEGVRFTVAKKTLIKRALANVGVTGEMPEMPGEVAYVTLAKGSSDVTAPARTLGSFIKKFKEKLMFVGGVMDGAYIDAKAVLNVASIPPVPVLRGMFVNVINSPIQRFAIALAEVAKKK